MNPSPILKSAATAGTLQDLHWRSQWGSQGNYDLIGNVWLHIIPSISVLNYFYYPIRILVGKMVLLLLSAYYSFPWHYILLHPLFHCSVYCLLALLYFLLYYYLHWVGSLAGCCEYGPSYLGHRPYYLLLLEHGAPLPQVQVSWFQLMVCFGLGWDQVLLDSWWFLSRLVV